MSAGHWRDWRTFAAIMAAGLVTGFFTWVGGQPAHPCRYHCSVTAYYKGYSSGFSQAGP